MFGAGNCADGLARKTSFVIVKLVFMIYMHAENFFKHYIFPLCHKCS